MGADTSNLSNASLYNNVPTQRLSLIPTRKVLTPESQWEYLYRSSLRTGQNHKISIQEKVIVDIRTQHKEDYSWIYIDLQY